MNPYIVKRRNDRRSIMEVKRLYRDTQNEMIAGVCAGIGEYFSIDPTIVRLIAVLAALSSGCFPGLIVYFVLLAVIPAKPSA